MDAYRAHPAQGSHDLMRALRGYRHWRYGVITPTPAMTVGSAAHCLLLEPGQFESRYTEAAEQPDDLITTMTAARQHMIDAGHKVPSKLRAGDVWAMLAELCPDAPTAEAWQRAEAERIGDRDALTAGMYAAAMGIARAVRADAIARDLLDRAIGTEVEDYFEVREGTSRVACKRKFDLLGDGWFADVKTTADPYEWGQRVRWSRESTLLQMYHYAMRTRRRCYIIAAGSSPPYDVVVYELTPDLLERGADAHGRAVMRVAGWLAVEAEAAIAGDDAVIPPCESRIVTVTEGGPQW